MNAIETVEQLKELMAKYDAARTGWIDCFGTPDGFDDWFTAQVLGKPEEV